MGVVVLGKKRAYIKNDQKKCPKRYHELLGLFDFFVRFCSMKIH